MTEAVLFSVNEDIGRAKALLQDGERQGLHVQMAAERRTIAAGASAEAREGITAFQGKREPAFR